MRKFLLTVVFMLCTVMGTYAVSNEVMYDDNAKLQYQTEQFDSVKVNCPAVIKFEYADSFGISIQSIDSILSKCITYQIKKDSILYINFKDYELLTYELNPKDILITVKSPKKLQNKLSSNYKLQVNYKMKNTSGNHKF